MEANGKKKKGVCSKVFATITSVINTTASGQFISYSCKMTQCTQTSSQYASFSHRQFYVFLFIYSLFCRGFFFFINNNTITLLYVATKNMSLFVQVPLKTSH